MNWKILDSDEQFNQLIQSSDNIPFAVFKHSTRCHVSSMSKNKLEKNWAELPADFQLYYLDLLTYRPLSNSVAEVLDVEHQSPQLLLIENGECVFHSSHSDIDISDLVKRVR